MTTYRTTSRAGRVNKQRRGITLFELLVAFGILSVIISVSAGLLVRHGRLLVSGRNQRLAVEELANRMELLQALPPADRDAFLAAPAPSAFAAAHLPGATLTAVAAAPDDDGLQRIELAIEWNEPGRRGHPLRLAGWLRSASGEGSP
jgi:Tfp pilus assembly protein PilV